MLPNQERPVVGEDGQEPPIARVNARSTDVFDLVVVRYYEGPSPYLEREAVTFDLALTGSPPPLPVEAYVAEVARIYPHLTASHYLDHAHLFARLVAEVGRLDLGLHQDLVRVQQRERVHRIAAQAIHWRTTHQAIYLVWDWLEAISVGEPFDHQGRMAELQRRFNRSPFGGPTTYALLSAADRLGIPTLYLDDEGLVQYGYARRHVRAVSTTFSTDSRLDSDFTTRKDDCKAMLRRMGLPVPTGEVVASLEEALEAVQEIGYPVAVKPLAGHKGIGVTANVQGPEELAAAYARAGGPEASVLVEASLAGTDFRLLCVNGRFVAALERRPPWVEGDGLSTIDALIERENARPEREDTPASAMGKIIRDEAMLACLAQQGLEPSSVPPVGRTVWLRKVANLSAGGVSIDVTGSVHLDNIILAQDVARQFRLTCLGIDVIAQRLDRSWKEGGLGIIEINAAPGVYMHVNPAEGQGIDVPGAILGTWFPTPKAARVPIFAFNAIGPESIKVIVDLVLSRYPHWNVGAVCPRGVFINRAERPLHKDYNTNVRNLLRDPSIDLLILGYDEETLELDGMLHLGHDLAVLDRPTPAEEVLARDLLPGGTLIKLTGRSVTIRRDGLYEEYQLDPLDRFGRVFLREMTIILERVG